MPANAPFVSPIVQNLALAGAVVFAIRFLLGLRGLSAIWRAIQAGAGWPGPGGLFNSYFVNIAGVAAAAFAEVYFYFIGRQTPLPDTPQHARTLFAGFIVLFLLSGFVVSYRLSVNLRRLAEFDR